MSYIETLSQMSEAERHLLLVAAMLAMTDEDNIDALHLATGQDLQAVDALREKLVEQFPDERTEAYAAACQVLDGDAKLFDPYGTEITVGAAVRLYATPQDLIDTEGRLVTLHAWSVLTVESVDYSDDGLVSLRHENHRFTDVGGSMVLVFDTAEGSEDVS